MFYKQLDSGKYRYFEKYFDEKRNKWRQVTVTLKSKSRVAQSEAKNRLARKIEQSKKVPTANEIQEEIVQNKTVQEIYEEWVVIRKQDVKPASFVAEQISLKGFIEKFSKYKVSEVTTADIQSYLMELDIANSTRKNRRIYIRILFKYAENIGYIDSNPADKVVLPKVRLEIETLERANEKFLSKEEMSSVLIFCKSYKKNIRYTLAMEFIFLTGCRFGEFASIRYQDVDFKNKLLRIDHTLEYRVAKYDDRVIQTPKTVGSIRTISLSNRCLEIIDYFQKNCLDDKFVFVNAVGGIFRQPVFYKFICDNCQKVLGNERKYGIHLLRHSHVSLLVELGVPIKAIMERVGHRDESITLRIYSHISGTIKNEISQKLNQINL